MNPLLAQRGIKRTQLHRVEDLAGPNNRRSVAAAIRSDDRSNKEIYLQAEKNLLFELVNKTYTPEEFMTKTLREFTFKGINFYKFKRATIQKRVHRCYEINLGKEFKACLHLCKSRQASDSLFNILTEKISTFRNSLLRLKAEYLDGSNSSRKRSTAPLIFDKSVSCLPGPLTAVGSADAADLLTDDKFFTLLS
eukprot:COSAG01_NODE_2312_length_7938_cov_4.108687_2_plen_194_part_00